MKIPPPTIGLRLIRQRALPLLCLLGAVVTGLPAQAGTMVNPDTHFSATEGPELYAAICQGCHMPDAKGAQGAGKYPALAGNPRVASAGYVVHNVLHGYHGMPAFADTLDDQQVANVVNYVRSHFGNSDTDLVNPDQVHQAR